MIRRDEALSAIEADPQFRKFPKKVQEQIRKDAKATLGTPKTPAPNDPERRLAAQPTPIPAPSPPATRRASSAAAGGPVRPEVGQRALAPYLPTVAAPAAPSFGPSDAFGENFAEGFGTNLTGAVLGAAERDIKRRAPKSLMDMMDDSQARQIDYKALLPMGPPAPPVSLQARAGQAAEALKTGAADTLVGIGQNLQGGGTAGVGEGLAGAAGRVAGTFADPAGILMDVASFGAAKPLLRTAPKAVQHLLPGAVSGFGQGAGTAIASGNPDAVLTEGTVSALMGGVTGATSKGAKAKLDDMNLAGAGRRLLTEEVGEFDPSRALSLNKKIREATVEMNRAREAGDAVLEQQWSRHIESLKDSRTVMEDRPAAGSSTAPPTRYYNERKYNFASPESREKFDQLTREVVHERGMNPKQRIPQAEVLRRAREMTGSSVDDLKYKDLKFGQSLSAVEYEAAKNVVDGLKDRAVEVEQQLNALPGTADPAARRQLEIELNSIERDIKGFMGVLIPSRSQKGRDLAYLKMMAQQSWDTTYWTARAQRVSQIPYDPANPNYRALDEIVKRGHAADQAGDAATVRQARIDLAKFMSKLERTPLLEALSAARKAGLLTGIKTIARNMGSNTINQVVEEAVKLPAAGIDRLISIFGETPGQRTVLAPTPGKILQGLDAIRTKGAREFHETMVHGVPLEQLANLELPREINTGTPFDHYINGVFRFQNAQDRLFKAYAYTRSLRDRAELVARAENLNGAQRAARIQAIMDDPTGTLGKRRADEMVLEAIADSEFATFTNDTVIGKKLASFRSSEGKTPTGQGINFFLDMIMPFVKTPSAVAMRVLEFTFPGNSAARVGGGRARAAIRERDLAALVRRLTPAEQKILATGISREMVGGTLIWLGMVLAREGVLTGTFEPDKVEEYEASGRSAGSLKIGGHWVPIGMLSPVGNLLVIGASLYRDGFNEQAITAATARTVLDQPMTQGAQDVVNVMKPDAEGITKAMGKLGGSIAGSWVPTIAGEVAQAFDPQGVDRAVSKNYPQSAIDAIKKKTPLPGGRGTLDAKTTGLGDTVPVPSGWAAFWAFSGKADRADADPVLREVLDRGTQLPKMASKVKFDGVEVQLSDDEARDLYLEQGRQVRETLTRLYNSIAYQGYTPERKDQESDNGARAAANAARARWVRMHAADLESRTDEGEARRRERRERRRTPVSPQGGTQ